MKRWMQLGAVVGAAPALWRPRAGAATLEEFGYLNMKTAGVENRGHRPLLTILASYAGKPALRSDAKSYFDRLVYNTRQKSVNGYFIVNSNGRFSWTRAGAGTIGPFYFTASEADLNERVRYAKIKEAAMNSGFDF